MSDLPDMPGTPTAYSASRRAVVLLSGGLDSATVLALARQGGLECYALTVRYGQQHAHEVACAERIASALGTVRHRIMEIDLRSFGGSSLVGDGEIPRFPKDRHVGSTLPVPPALLALPALPDRRPFTGTEKNGGEEQIPSTYVPARNTIFLSLALAWAEVLEAGSIHLGINAIDYSGYPDCRPEYLEAFRKLAQLATRRGVEGSPIEIQAPLLHLTKGEIVALGKRLGLDFGLTSSCYDPSPEGVPCGRCASCLLRRRGFEDAGLVDPPHRETGGLVDPPHRETGGQGGGSGRSGGKTLGAAETRPEKSEKEQP